MAKPSLNYYRALHVGLVKTDVIQFATIQGAIGAITDNDATHRYAVYVHPGTYEQIVMEDYVDVIAVGGREETIISHVAAADHTDPTVTGENSMIKGFTIVSDGATNVARCVEAKAGFEIEDCVLRIDNPKGTEIALNALEKFDMRRCLVDVEIPARALTAVELAAADQAYNIDDCKIGGATNSLLVTNCLTLTITRSTLFNLLVHNACATSTIIRDCVLKDIDFDGGTLCELHHTYVESIDVAAGIVDAFGGTIRKCTGSAGTRFVWWLNDSELQVIANMKIAHALGIAGAGDIIHIAPSATDYAESGLGMVADVTLKGTHPEHCIIRTGDGINPIIASAQDCVLVDLTIENTDAAQGAIKVTANTCRAHGCVITGQTSPGIAVEMEAGAFYAYDTLISAGEIDLSTAGAGAACSLGLYGCRVDADPIDIGDGLAGTLAHTLTFVECDLHNQNVASAATGGTTMDMRGCSHVGQVSNAGSGAFTIRDSDVRDVTTTSTGDITVYGGYVDICTAASAGGAIVWWLNSDEIKVLANMLIAHALAAAAAAVPTPTENITIYLMAAEYTETGLTLQDNVNICGVSHDKTIITSNIGGTILATTAAVVCALRHIQVYESNSGVCLNVSAGATVYAHDCEFKAVALANAITMDNGTLELHTSHVSVGDIELSTNACALLLDHTELVNGNLNSANDGSAHTVSLHYCDFHGNNIDLDHTGAGSTEVVYCSNITDFDTHNSAAGTVSIDNTLIGGNATKAGTAPWTVRLARINSVANNNGTGGITIYGGYIHVCAGSTGSVVWYHDHANEFMVIENMEIAHALAVAGAGAMIRVGEGTFAITDPLTIPQNNITLEGAGRGTFIDGDGLATGEHAIVISAKTNVTIRNLAIQTSAGVGNTCHCVFIEDGANGTVIDGVTIVDSDSDGIHMEGTNTTDITIKNCSIEDVDDNGIFVDMAAANTMLRLRVINNTIQSAGTDGIATGITGAGCNYAEIIGNTIFESGAKGMYLRELTYSLVNDNIVYSNTGTGILIGTSSTHNVIDGNECYSNGQQGIEVNGNATDNTVSGNACHGNTACGIEFTGASHRCTATGNTCRSNQYGIYFESSDYGVMTGNNVSDNTEDGLYFDSSDYGTCSGNVSSYNDSVGTQYNGIWVENSDYCVISDNVFDHNGLHGIFIDRSDHCVVNGNSCNNSNTGDGINVTGAGGNTADNNTITGNGCHGNAGNGIEIAGGVDADKNIVVANQLLGNTGANLVDNGTLTEVAHNITV